MVIGVAEGFLLLIVNGAWIVVRIGIVASWLLNLIVSNLTVRIVIIVNQVRIIVRSSVLTPCLITLVFFGA